MAVPPSALSVKKHLPNLALSVVVCVTVSLIPVARTVRCALVNTIIVLVHVSGNNYFCYVKMTVEYSKL